MAAAAKDKTDRKTKVFLTTPEVLLVAEEVRARIEKTSTRDWVPVIQQAIVDKLADHRRPAVKTVSSGVGERIRNTVVRLMRSTEPRQPLHPPHAPVSATHGFPVPRPPATLSELWHQHVAKAMPTLTQMASLPQSLVDDTENFRLRDLVTDGCGKTAPGENELRDAVASLVSQMQPAAGATAPRYATQMSTPPWLLTGTSPDGGHVWQVRVRILQSRKTLVDLRPLAALLQRLLAWAETTSLKDAEIWSSVREAYTDLSFAD